MLFGGAYTKIYVFLVYLPCTAPLVELGGHSLLDLVWRCEYLECSPERDVGIRDHLSARVGISVFYFVPHIENQS